MCIRDSAISELKTAFQIGFLLFVPFMVIDMIVASVLMSMGMMMIPPTVISLAFKLLLFVMVDAVSYTHLNISSELINNNNSNVLENINLLKNNTVFESENINIFENVNSNVIEEISLNSAENINIDLNQETLSNTTNLPLEEIVKTLNLEEDKVVTKDNIDKLLTVLCDKDGNEIKKDKFIEVVDSSKGESKKDTSQGVEMLKMVFNIDKMCIRDRSYSCGC